MSRRGKYKNPNYIKEYREKNKEKIAIRAKEYKEENSEEIKKYRRRYRKVMGVEIAEYSKNYGKNIRNNNPDKAKDQHLKYGYGITIKEYKALLDNQNGLCAICLEEEKHKDKRTGKIRSLAVDHDHTTGRVRGLLCSRCNRALGSFGDSIEILLRASKYLKRSKS